MKGGRRFVRDRGVNLEYLAATTRVGLTMSSRGAKLAFPGSPSCGPGRIRIGSEAVRYVVDRDWAVGPCAVVPLDAIKDVVIVEMHVGPVQLRV